MSTKSAVINDRHIICPHCQNDVTVLRPHGGGAAYAKKWKQVPERVLEVLGIWNRNKVYANYWLTKETLLGICQHAGLNIKFTSLNARVSELVAIGLATSSKHERVDHTTTRKPLYKINREKAKQVLDVHGKLEALN